MWGMIMDWASFLFGMSVGVLTVAIVLKVAMEFWR